MVSGPEHYQIAERFTEAATQAWTEDGDREAGVLHYSAAQVHATLALAAATALHPREALTTQFRDQVAAPWVEVAG